MRSGSFVEAGAAFVVAEKRKTNAYREAAQAAGKVMLETLACEIGGRWSENCIKWVAHLAKYKASSEPPPLQRASEFAWHSRWWPIFFFFAFIPRCVLILKRAEKLRKGGYSAFWLPYGLLPSVLFLACVKRFASVLFVISGPTP